MYFSLMEVEVWGQWNNSNTITLLSNDESVFCQMLRISAKAFDGFGVKSAYKFSLLSNVKPKDLMQSSSTSL